MHFIVKNIKYLLLTTALVCMSAGALARSFRPTQSLSPGYSMPALGALVYYALNQNLGTYCADADMSLKNVDLAVRIPKHELRTFFNGAIGGSATCGAVLGFGVIDLAYGIFAASIVGGLGGAAVSGMVGGLLSEVGIFEWRDVIEEKRMRKLMQTVERSKTKTLNLGCRLLFENDGLQVEDDCRLQVQLTRRDLQQFVLAKNGDEVALLGYSLDRFKNIKHLNKTRFYGLLMLKKQDNQFYLVHHAAHQLKSQQQAEVTSFVLPAAKLSSPPRPGNRDFILLPDDWDNRHINVNAQYKKLAHKGQLAATQTSNLSPEQLQNACQQLLQAHK